MKKRMQIVIGSLAMVACFAWNQSQALAQAEQFKVNSTVTNRTYLEPPVVEQVGSLTRLTVHVSYTQLCSDPRLEGTMEVTGVWLIDPRNVTSVGHGEWTSACTMGGVIEGTWCMDKSGTMRGIGFVTGGDFDGALLHSVSVAGDPFLGWMVYEAWLLLPASE